MKRYKVTARQHGRVSAFTTINREDAEVKLAEYQADGLEGTIDEEDVVRKAEEEKK